MYITDGDYIKDIENNDLRNRYRLTKGATQQMANIDPFPLYLVRAWANLYTYAQLKF